MPTTASAAPSAPARSLATVAACCLAAMGEGFDLQAPGVTLPVLAPLFHLSGGEGQGFLAGFLSDRSLFLSMSTFGLMLGALVGGMLADRVGRKWVTVASVVLFALFSALTAHADSAQMLLWCRFLTGVGLGGAMPNLIAIVAESVSPNRRGAAVGCLYASLPFGGSLVSLSSYAFGDAENWRTIYYLGALVPLLAAVALVIVAPNTKPEQRRAAADGGSAMNALFGEGRAANTWVLWIGFFFALIAMYILLGWLPSLLVAKGLSRPDASVVQLGFNLFGAAGSVLTGFILDRTRQPVSVALIFLSAIVSLGILAGAPGTLAIAFVLGSLVGCTVSGTQAILYALAPICYPSERRSTGVGVAVAVGRFGSAVGPLLAGALLSIGFSGPKVLGALIPILALAGVAAVFVSVRTWRAGRAAAGATAAA